jgi:hypothetical protein
MKDTLPETATSKKDDEGEVDVLMSVTEEGELIEKNDEGE